MGIPGRFTKDQFGYSIPLNAPLYHKFPVVYRDARVVSIEYDTDLDAALALLPSQLEVDEEKPVKVTAIFADYPWSTVGSYKEVAQVLHCKYKHHDKYKDLDMLYAVHFHVTTAEAMSAGREIAGFPKKIGDIEFDGDKTYASRLESPAGVCICSAQFTPVQKVVNPKDKEPVLPTEKKYVSLRVIPNPEHEFEPSLRQLIGTKWILGPGEVWGGVGQLHLTAASSQDPYHKLPIKKITASTLFLGSMEASAVTFVDNV